MNDDLLRRAGTNLPQIQNETKLQDKQQSGNTFDLSKAGPGIGGLIDSVEQQGPNFGNFNPGQELTFDPLSDPSVSGRMTIADKQKSLRQSMEANVLRLASMHEALNIDAPSLIYTLDLMSDLGHRFTSSLNDSAGEGQEGNFDKLKNLFAQKGTSRETFQAALQELSGKQGNFDTEDLLAKFDQRNALRSQFMSSLPNVFDKQENESVGVQMLGGGQEVESAGVQMLGGGQTVKSAGVQMFSGQEVESAGVQMVGQHNLMTPVGTRVEGGTPLEYKYLSGNQAGDPHVNLDTPLLRHEDTPQIRQEDTPLLRGEDTPLLRHEDTPQLRAEDTPLLRHADTPLLSKELVQKLIDLFDQNAGFSVA